MASVTERNYFLDRKPVEKVLLCQLVALEKWSVEPVAVAEDAVNVTLQETLAKLWSDELNAVATVLRSVVGQIDSLLLERQLAEFGFDAVRTSVYKTKGGGRQQP